MIVSRAQLALVVLVAALAPASRAAPQDFKLTSGEVRFEIEAPLDTISGVSRGVSGQVTVDPAAWTSGTAARIDVDLSSFRTGIDLRDEDLRDQFFETGKFMKATLTLTSIERASGPALIDGTAAEAILAGTLSLHGVERAVKIPAKVTLDKNPTGQRVVVTGDFVVPLLEHKIQRPKRLVFKLGTDVKVSVRAVFRAPLETPQGAAPAPVVADASEVTLPPAPPVVARPVAEKPAPPRFQFAAATAEGRGERAFSSTKIGGPKNGLSCSSCHSVADERKGVFEKGEVKPNSTMWNAATRATLWQGLASTPGEASDICARLYMLKDEGLDPGVQSDLDAYLRKLARDPQPALDYDALHVTRRAVVKDLDKGDAARGKTLVGTYCASCHKKGAVRPELEPGLYEPEMIVARVRRMPGADNVQMPPISIERLPDSELRDIVAWLAGDEKSRIFTRRKR